MKKNAIILSVIMMATSHIMSQTLVKLKLPNNCNATSTQIDNVLADKNPKLELYPNPNSGNSAYRYNYRNPSNYYDYIGFRVVFVP